jgi:hypothetical protein
MTIYEIIVLLKVTSKVFLLFVSTIAPKDHKNAKPKVLLIRLKLFFTFPTNYLPTSDYINL